MGGEVLNLSASCTSALVEGLVEFQSIPSCLALNTECERYGGSAGRGLITLSRTT